MSIWKQKFVLNTWHFVWIFFFDYQIFSFYRKWEFSIFLEIVSIIFCLITRFIKLIQTVQNQKSRFEIC